MMPAKPQDDRDQNETNAANRISDLARTSGATLTNEWTLCTRSSILIQTLYTTSTKVAVG